MMLIDSELLETLEEIKRQIFDMNYPEEQEISLEEVISRKAKCINRMLFRNSDLLTYFEELGTIKLKTLKECKAEIVVEEDEMEEQEKDDIQDQKEETPQ